MVETSDLRVNEIYYSAVQHYGPRHSNELHITKVIEVTHNIQKTEKKRKEKTKKKKLEMPGIEPVTFYMQSGRSTTEPHQFLLNQCAYCGCSTESG